MGEEPLSLTARLRGTSNKSDNGGEEETSPETAEEQGTMGEVVSILLQDQGSGESVEAQGCPFTVGSWVRPRWAHVVAGMGEAALMASLPEAFSCMWNNFLWGMSGVSPSGISREVLEGERRQLPAASVVGPLTGLV